MTNIVLTGKHTMLLERCVIISYRDLNVLSKRILSSLLRMLAAKKIEIQFDFSTYMPGLAT